MGPVKPYGCKGFCTYFGPLTFLGVELLAAVQSEALAHIEIVLCILDGGGVA